MSAKHWRLFVIENNGDTNFLNFAELVLRSTTGGAQIAVGGIVTTSGEFDATTFAAANVFDGNTSTTWAVSPTSNQWVAYEFSDPVDIVEYAILPRATHSARAPKRFQLESSADGVIWTSHTEELFTGWADGVYVAFSILPIVPGPPVVFRFTHIKPPPPSGRLYGTTAIAGTPDAPVRRRVQICEAVSNAHGHIFPSVGASVAWTWADDAGNWEVNNLDPALKYHVIAYDHTGVHDPVIKLNQIPEV